jgi:hypothetical protein
MTPKILRVIDNVPMGRGHEGLKLIAEQVKIDVTTLKPGELVLFLNRRKDKLKTLGAPGKGKLLGPVSYIKTENGQLLTMDAIQHIVKSMNPDGTVDYDKALEAAVRHLLTRRAKRVQVVSPLRAYRTGKEAGVTAAK